MQPSSRRSISSRCVKDRVLKIMFPYSHTAMSDLHDANLLLLDDFKSDMVGIV